MQEICSSTSLTFLPTADAAVGDSFHEVSRFREDAVPLIDGDAAGDGYLAELLTQAPPPKYILRYGKGASIECVSAWILEPTLASPGPHVADLMGTSSDRSLRRLQEALIHSKEDRELHECLAWEALETPAAVMRAGELLQDLALLAAGKSPPNVRWTSHATAGGTIVHTAGHITRV